jgi:hypothetical protein
MWAQQEQRSPARIVSGAGSLKSPDKFEEPGQEGWSKFSPRPHQRACQDPLTRQGGDALRAYTLKSSKFVSRLKLNVK